MNDEINYKNNPLNGVGLKQLLTELKDYYGFDILLAYLNLNCFRNNPSVESSVKFLKKTDWARKKVEGFYLYSFKSLPEPSTMQSKLDPRDRIIPDDQTPGEPAQLSLEDAEQLREQREIRAAEFDKNSNSGNRRINNQNSQRPNRSVAKDEHESSRSSKRGSSTANNPWGLPKP